MFCHGYLDTPNLLVLFLKLFVRTRVVWGLRASTIELAHYDWLHRLAAKLEDVSSRWADLIIINSALGLEQHVARGFPRKRCWLIPNGFDTDVFKPNREAGQKLRREWGVPEEVQLIGYRGTIGSNEGPSELFTGRRTGASPWQRLLTLYVWAMDQPAFAMKLRMLASLRLVKQRPAP